MCAMLPSLRVLSIRLAPSCQKPPCYAITTISKGRSVI
ncbi:hypothetical protein APS_0905 [Acetobacter pasteurianus subsp. pasteurianus LMG 1262 = NBRC 106471]|nr:hypothetical protein APS_0905 [Acetobacter pasteurianus subsp. pasteurianus LMG 1262 = NBRC 106471]